MKLGTLALVMLAGCTVDPISGGADGGADGSGDDDSSNADLAPAYALHLEARYTHCTKNTAGTACTAAAPTEDSIEVIGLWQVQQAGADVSGSLTLCQSTSKAGGNDLSVNPSFLRGLPAISLGGTIGGDGKLATDMTAVVLGARLSNPLNDAVPTEPADARVVDQDGDGNPGFSITASAGKIFAALRVAFELEAPIGAGGELAGSAQLTTDQSILGDSIPLFDARASAADLAATTLVTGENHTFELIPVTTATCDGAVAAIAGGGSQGPSCQFGGETGTCIDTSTTSCGGELHRGLCDGGDAIICCLP